MKFALAPHAHGGGLQTALKALKHGDFYEQGSIERDFTFKRQPEQ
jgi:hypothetical protein